VSEDPGPLEERTLDVIECGWWFIYTATTVASIYYPYIAVVIMFFQWAVLALAKARGINLKD
jgi:hypothetical protein